jgi:hypothetical protein
LGRHRQCPHLTQSGHKDPQRLGYQLTLDGLTDDKAIIEKSLDPAAMSGCGVCTQRIGSETVVTLGAYGASANDQYDCTDQQDQGEKRPPT